MAQVSPSSDHILVDDFYFSLFFDEDLNNDEPVSDEKYAEELQFQEALMSSVITKSQMSNHDSMQTLEMVTIVAVQANAPEPESVTIKEIKSVGQTSQEFCEICVEKKDSQDMLRILTCSHSFCIECVTKYISSRIADNISEVSCPAWNCKGYLQLDSCSALLPANVIERWEDALSQSMILGLPRIYCPFKDCSGMLVVEDENEEEAGESECPYCHRLFCARCNVAWHAGVDCEEWQKLKVDERGREDLMLIELVKQKHWMRCPNCQFYVERATGCPHITCMCRFEFCYGCGAEWGKTCQGCSKE